MTGDLAILAGLSLGLEFRLRHLGFRPWSVGGVSRAWRKFRRDGGHTLVTDAGGYDLPHPDGPFLVWSFDRSNDANREVEFFETAAELLRTLTETGEASSRSPVADAKRFT